MSRVVVVVAATLLGIVLLYSWNRPTNVKPVSTQPKKVESVSENVISAAETAAKKVVAIIHPGKGWKEGTATVFWVGEASDADNGYIPNNQSVWDEEWQSHFGGVDDPDRRCASEPCAFVPKENPFYVALPYNDLDERGFRKANASRIPWQSARAGSILKNRWIAVQTKGKTCYGQWQDVGPFEENDIEYVFGDATVAKNRFGEKAGIDLSPAMRDCLDVGDVSRVEWRHVEAADVPPGPWKDIVTDDVE